jgi:hypothetical protein
MESKHYTVLANIAFYIQRISDGKLLLGDGPFSDPGNLRNPNDGSNWDNLGDSVTLDNLYWIVANISSATDQATAIGNIIDQMPISNGSWENVMYRVYPIYKANF